MEKKIRFKEIYMFFLAVSLLIYGGYSMLKNNGEDTKETIFKNNPQLTKLEEMSSNPIIFKGYGMEENVLIGIGEAVGYQSTIEVMTKVDLNGEILDVSIINQGETPAFFEKIQSARFQERFQGLTIHEPIYAGNAEGYSGSSQGVNTKNKADAVSGATISSVAIVEAVNEITSQMNKVYFNKNVANPFVQFSFSTSDIALLLLFAVAVLSMFIKGISKYRKWVLIYTIIVGGFLLNKFITFGMLSSFFSGQWPKLTNVSWYILLIGTMGVLILSGRNIYCLWICPFGAMQESINNFGGLKSIKLNPKLVKMFRMIPLTLAYMAIMLCFYTGNVQTLAYDPFGAIFSLTALPIMWLTLPILIFISLIQKRFYCTYFCPIGFILNSLVKGRNRFIKLIKRGEENGKKIEKSI